MSFNCMYLSGEILSRLLVTEPKVTTHRPLQCVTTISAVLSAEPDRALENELRLAQMYF